MHSISWPPTATNDSRGSIEDINLLFFTQITLTLVLVGQQINYRSSGTQISKVNFLCASRLLWNLYETLNDFFITQRADMGQNGINVVLMRDMRTPDTGIPVGESVHPCKQRWHFSNVIDWEKANFPRTAQPLILKQVSKYNWDWFHTRHQRPKTSSEKKSPPLMIDNIIY